MKNKLNVNTLRKIPIKKLIDTLVSIYNSGVDYIDIVGKNSPTNNKDIINIKVRDEYKTNNKAEYYNVDNDEETEDDQDKPFSDKNISDLI